jgi:RNA polymerase sigma factor (sigma-70 family)
MADSNLNGSVNRQGVENLFIDFLEQEDEALFEKICHETQSMVFKIAISITGNKSDAMDVCQQVYIAFARQYKQIRSPGALLQWLRILTKAKASQVIGKGTRQDRIALQCIDDTDVITNRGLSPDAMTEKREMIAALQQAISLLPPKQRLAISCHLNGKTGKEAALELRITEVNYRSVLHRAITKLKQEMIEWL